MRFTLSVAIVSLVTRGAITRAGDELAAHGNGCESCRLHGLVSL